MAMNSRFLSARQLWLQWLLATLTGSSVGSVVGAFLLYLLNSTFTLFLFGLAVGIAVSVAQWWALNKRIPRFQRWIWVSSICSTLCITVSPGMIATALVIPYQANDDWYLKVMGLFGVLSGFITGLVQWFVVFRAFAAGALWLLASPIGCGLGLAIGSRLAYFPIRGALPSVDLLSDFISPGLIFGGVAGLISGAITGFAVVAIVQNHRPKLD